MASATLEPFPTPDFEFRLHNITAPPMLSADQLFSGGKLLPLNPAPPTIPHPPSPKAPRCSTRLRHLLFLRHKQPPSDTPPTKPQRGLKHFLNRSSPKPDTLPLLHQDNSTPKSDSDSGRSSVSKSEPESVLVSGRLSLSSSSTASDHDDLPRLSLDSDRRRVPRRRQQLHPPLVADHPHMRAGRTHVRRTSETIAVPRGASVDSPRMNSYGKVVFQSLERSSSSPSTFNGGPRPKYRGMERSYSANVRITPVLNVPVCSLRGSGKFGFGQLFSPQKKDVNGKVAVGVRSSGKGERVRNCGTPQNI